MPAKAESAAAPGPSLSNDPATELKQTAEHEQAAEHELIAVKRRLRHLERDHQSLLRNTRVSEEIAENGKRLLLQVQTRLEDEIRGHERTEATLRVAKRDAELASDAKSLFLATMSHEIRTPLNGVIGMLDLLLSSELDSDQKDRAKLAQTSARSLVLLINRLLDFSKIEAGHLEIVRKPIQLAQLVDDLLTTEAIAAHKKGLHICAVLDPQIPKPLLGDAGRLRQILLNLINNAVKYTESGEIVLRVTRSDDAGEPRIRFEVSDTGIGIQEKNHERLFEPFTQVDSSTTRAYSGAGLGLTISDGLVAALGGELHVQSESGQGSCFSFELPLATVPASQAHSPRRFLEGQVIGVADRHSAFIDHVRTILEPLGAEVCAIVDENAARVLAAERPVLALLVAVDFGSLIAAPPPDTPMLVTVPLGSEAPEAPSAGATLFKPLRGARLVEHLIHCLSGHRPNPLGEAGAGTPVTVFHTRSAEPTEPESWPAKVLIVDDNVANQLVARLLLERLGCQVSTADSGAEAISLSLAESYDLIFMDCSMPHMDGYETTRRLRIQDHGGVTPTIVAVTAFALPDDRDKCLEAGMDEYLSKPIDLHALRILLRRHCSPAPH